MPPFIHRRPDAGCRSGQVAKPVVIPNATLQKKKATAHKVSPQLRRGAVVRAQRDRTKNRRKSAVSLKCSGECAAEVLGTVEETDSQHRRRHEDFSGACTRCVWDKFGKRWAANCGLVPEADKERVHLRSWCQRRPVDLGGTWALGCQVCFLASQLLKDLPKSHPKKIRLFTKWSMYAIRGDLQASRIREHATSAEHRQALSILKNPSTVAGVVVWKYDKNESDLFAKAVPQVEDWMAAWAASRSNQSWRNAASNATLFEQGSFTRGAGGQRCQDALKKMVAIMREVIRVRKRAWLEECSFVSLGLDDRKRYTLILFTCDIGLAPPQAVTELGARGGVLGAFDGMLGLTEEDFDEDYAIRVVGKVMKAIRLFYTDLESGVDEGEVAKFCLKVRLVAADQALQKSVEYMTRIFHNLTQYHRDPCHALRIAIREPLVRAERFDAIFQLLFLDDHALLKDLRFSDLWAGKLVEWQRRLVEQRGYQGGAITHVIHTFTFAYHRFESFCTPLFDLLMIIPAIIWMLKTIAEDWRDNIQVKRALRALEAIDAQFILDLGLIVDYGALCLRMLRHFDRHSKDPSLTRSILRDWEKQSSSLFRECNIFRLAPPQASEEPGPEPACQTATQIAMEQINYISEVDYANRVRDFQAIPPRQLFEAGAQQMNQVIVAAQARVAADFTDATDFYMCLEVFNLDVWLPLLPLASSQSIRSEGDGLRLARKLRAYLDYFSTEYKTIDDWIMVVCIAVRHRNLLLNQQPQRSPEYRLDHRICWALSVAEIAQNHRWAVLPVRGYLSWMDGTGSVERGLGTHASVLAGHSGNRPQKLGEDANEMCVELRLDGPVDSAEIHYDDRRGERHAGEFAKESVSLWIAIRGRRFGCYKKRKDAGFVHKSIGKQKLGTFTLQRKMQMKALDSISEGKGNNWLAGASRGQLKEAGVSALGRLSERLRDFNKQSKKKREQKTEAGLWRGFAVTPSAPRRNNSTTQSLASSQTQASSSSDSNATLVVRPLCAISDSVGTDKRRRYKDMTAGALQSATSFVVESLRDLHLGHSSPAKLLVWLHAVAKGRSVVTQESQQKRQFLRAIDIVAAKLHFTDEFRKKHEHFFTIFMSLLQREAATCKWRSIGAPEQDALIIKCTQDFRLFLLNVQRVPRGSLAFSAKSQRARPPRSL